MNIKDAFIRNHIIKNYHAKNKPESRLNIHENTGRKVCLLAYVDPARLREMEAGIHFLKKHFTELSYILYTPQLKEPWEGLHVFTKKDFTWLKGLKQSADLSKINAKHNDLLIVYNPINAHEIESLAAHVQAPTRIGTHQAYSEVYNILYEMPTNGDFKRFLHDIVQLIKSFQAS
jgi:hypothetical protein